MTLRSRIARAAQLFGYHATEARYASRHNDSGSARWHAKNARSDWRALCQLTGLPIPRAHPRADDFRN